LARNDEEAPVPTGASSSRQGCPGQVATWLVVLAPDIGRPSALGRPVVAVTSPAWSCEPSRPAETRLAAGYRLVDKALQEDRLDATLLRCSPKVHACQRVCISRRVQKLER